MPFEDWKSRMIARANRSRFSQPTTPALAELLGRGIPLATERLALMRRYAQHGRVADRDQIFELFLPWIRILACRLKARNPAYYRNDLEDMIADGAVGLLEAIQWHDTTDPRFHVNVRQRISRVIYFGQRRMNFGRKAGDDHRSEIAKARADLVAEHGRVPTQDEVTAKLREIFPNPNFVIGNEPNLESTSADDATGYRGHDPIDRRERSPDAPAMDRETIKLALGDLKGRDRQIFKMSLKGIAEEQIGGKFGLTRARVSQIVNGLLWQARARADLAQYFAVQPEPLPAGCNPGNAPSIAKFPPARRAVSA
jgi:RNA polymerase sigma factor (sigma-70 family)